MNGTDQVNVSVEMRKNKHYIILNSAFCINLGGETVFARIMAVVMAVILLTTVCLSAVWWMTLRNQQIDARLDHLISEAEKIAYLAGNLNGDSLMDTRWDRDSETRKTLNNIADRVGREFGAYITVLDRTGGVMTYTPVAGDEYPEFMNSLNEALPRILSGETIRVRSESGEAPTFTVGVPFEMGGVVTGAVFIRTQAQRIESGLGEILWRVVVLAAAVTALTGVVVFLFVRRRLKPLKRLEAAAATIAEGDFSVQVDEKKGDPELRELSGAFNTMTKKLQGVEANRREFVVDDLLALSRLEREDAKMDITDFDINEMLRRAVIRRMNDLEAKKIDISCEFDEDQCRVRADSDRIEQVVINLLDNAIKFTPEGGKITLESGTKNGIAEITVRDSGCGIAPEDRDRIFDRFFTADRAHTAGKGTGLGLSICKRIMEMHGQSIRLLDTEEGAAFRFTLQKAVH